MTRMLLHEQIALSSVLDMTPGSKAGRKARGARLSSGGRGEARSLRSTGVTSSSMSQEPGVGRPRDQELAKLVVAIERLSDTDKRHGNILRDGWLESSVTEKEPTQSLRLPPGDK